MLRECVCVCVTQKSVSFHGWINNMSRRDSDSTSRILIQTFSRLSLVPDVLCETAKALRASSTFRWKEETEKPGSRQSQKGPGGQTKGQVCSWSWIRSVRPRLWELLVGFLYTEVVWFRLVILAFQHSSVAFTKSLSLFKDMVIPRHPPECEQLKRDAFCWRRELLLLCFKGEVKCWT